MDVIEKINECVKILDEVDEYFKSIPEKQSENDMAISDIYHYIENNQISTKGSYRLIKELKKVRDERRVIKNNYELLQVFNSNKKSLSEIY